VRKKNRKLRRLRELYPELNIKLFYARDFRALMLKYGKLALFEGLSGTSGQVTSRPSAPRPPRPPRRDGQVLQIGADGCRSGAGALSTVRGATSAGP
jgi:hypothetical protein